jgi:hypothetical protein
LERCNEDEGLMEGTPAETGGSDAFSLTPDFSRWERV